MPHPYKRADRVGDLIRRELGRLLLREVKDPRLQQVTITAVEVSGDLRHARVFFTGRARSTGSGQAGQEGAEKELTGLRSAAGFLRGHLGRTLRLRYAPELAFEVDQSVERSLHVAALLKQLASEDVDG